MTKQELEELTQKVLKKWGLVTEAPKVAIRQTTHEVAQGNPPALEKVREWSARASAGGIPVRAGFGPTREARGARVREDMTITEESTTWSGMLTPYDAATVARYVAGVKRWLMRSGGTMAVREAEVVGDMVVLSGREVVSGLVVASSVPAAELVARAAA